MKHDAAACFTGNAEIVAAIVLAIRVNERQTSFQLEVATCTRRLDKSLLYGFVSQTSLPETIKRLIVGDSISLGELASASSGLLFSR